MASKDNKFAKLEGGAMLTPNANAQPSFRPMNSGGGMPMGRPGQGLNKNEDSPNNQEDNQNKEKKQNPQDESNDKGEQNAKSPKEKLEKEALKKGGEAALQAAGVPAPVAKTIVDKAEETGTLDKVMDEVKKKKKQTLVKVIPAIAGTLLPIVFQFLIIIAIVSIIFAFYGWFENIVNTVVNFFVNGWGSIRDFFDTDHKSEASFMLSIPDDFYPSDTSTENMIAAASITPFYYKAYTTSDSEEREKAFYDSLWQMAEFSFKSFKKSDGTTLTDTEIQGYVNKINEPLGTTSAPKISFWDMRIANNNAQTVLQAFSTAWSKELKNVMSESTAEDGTKKEAYQFDLNLYYTNLDNYINDKIMTEEQRKSSNYKGELSNYHDGAINYMNKFIIALNKRPATSESGSSSGEDLISYLGSIYGDESCALLTSYEPGTHEYTESQGVSSKEIHSVSDGEVIYAYKNGQNLMNYWNNNDKKCMCGNNICDNYDGSQIKIKFMVDDIEYIATYSNLATVNYDKGDKVNKGDIIGTEGNTGCTNTNKLKFTLTSENGINYNTNDLLYKCSSYINTVNACNISNLNINLLDCNDKSLIKQISFYDYVKEETYKNFKIGINETEFLKTGVIITASNMLKNNNYQVGTKNIDIEVCDYVEPKINLNDSIKMDESLNKVRGQIMTYNDKFVSLRYNSTCMRKESNKNANSIYNTLCINMALEMAKNNKKYTDILAVYYPNYQFDDNYCQNYSANINQYVLKNNKQYLSNQSYSEEEYTKFNQELDEKIQKLEYGSRAAVVEVARYINLGFEYKIPYKIGGNYLKKGLNTNWYNDGFDSCGFVSWVLYNGGAKITESMNINQLISSPNIGGNLKITGELYKYFDQIQVGDLAWKNGQIGIIIGKNDGILYVAEVNNESGLIVTNISSYGESNSSYTHIYFADNYYTKDGNITSMW